MADLSLRPFVLLVHGAHGATHSRSVQPAASTRSRKLIPVLNGLSRLLLLAIVLPATAQDDILQIMNWRVQPGDNPGWSRPDFDDSQWPAEPEYPQMGMPGTGGIRWYRATFQLPTSYAGQKLALGMGPLDEVYDVYINGTLIGGYGHWQPDPHAPFPRHLAFPIPAGVLTSSAAHIAIRRWVGGAGLWWVIFGSSGNISRPHPPTIGPQAAIDLAEQIHPIAGAVEELPWDFRSMLFLFAAALSFGFWSVQRRKAVLVYIGSYCLLWSLPSLISIPLVSSSIMARSWAPTLMFFLDSASGVFALLLLASLCPRYRRILQIGAILAAGFAFLSAYGFAAQSYPAIMIWIYGSMYSQGLFNLIAIWGLLQQRSIGSFAIAACLLLDAAGWIWGFVNRLDFHLGSPVLYSGPFRFDLRGIPGVLFVFVTLLVLYLRFREEHVRQVAIDQELAAARSMQEHLLTAGETHPPGFTIDAVYRPAREVGGDFYRTVPLEDGSLLVILGDVSGKGLDAALLVAVILGSLANETHRSPASLLAYLNQAVMGRTAGGFITACCARFYPDGRVVLANAGQISPYLEGRELQFENGLPLGISRDATYSETEIETGKPITFLSDGVVEARNASGELLGFDRTAPLTTRSAAEIADAAQQWGQEDDMTVLSVARAAMVQAVPA